MPATRDFGTLAGALGSAFPGSVLQSMGWSFGARSLAILEVAQAGRGLDEAAAPVVDLLRFARVTYDADRAPLRIVEWLSGRPEVEVAYLEGGRQRPPAALAGQDPLESKQRYLQKAQVGLGVTIAWGKSGGEGQGIGFVDLEQGWLFGHEDLMTLGLTKPLYGSNELAAQGHGTAVLGVVAARRDGIGVVGLAPQVRVIGVASPYSGLGNCCKPDVIQNVLDQNMSPGDVLLIEIQTAYQNTGPLLPVEAEPAIHKVLEYGTFTLGITIVEAAGNGGVFLDSWEPTPGVRPFDRQGAGFQDSGAILVGGVDSVLPHNLTQDLNYGNRLDCVAWGDGVYTSGYDDSIYAPGKIYTRTHFEFSGTSSASALVAGAAILVQGMEKAKSGKPLDPATLRALLSDPRNATVCPASVMPDLEKIVNNRGY